MFTSGNFPDFIWDDINLEKLALHNVEPYEVEEAFTDPEAVPRRARKGRTSASRDLKRYTLVGRAFSGRLLKVPFEVLHEGVRPVTAFDAGKRDYTQYFR